MRAPRMFWTSRAPGPRARTMSPGSAWPADLDVARWPRRVPRRPGSGSALAGLDALDLVLGLLEAYAGRLAVGLDGIDLLAVPHQSAYAVEPRDERAGLDSQVLDDQIQLPLDAGGPAVGTVDLALDGADRDEHSDEKDEYCCDVHNR